MEKRNRGLLIRELIALLSIPFSMIALSMLNSPCPASALAAAKAELPDSLSPHNSHDHLISRFQLFSILLSSRIPLSTVFTVQSVPDFS
jgi:hypothetical protein